MLQGRLVRLVREGKCRAKCTARDKHGTTSHCRSEARLSDLNNLLSCELLAAPKPVGRADWYLLQNIHLVYIFLLDYRVLQVQTST